MNAACDFFGLQLLVIYPADVDRHVDTGRGQWPVSVNSSVKSSAGVKLIHVTCAMQCMCVCVCVWAHVPVCMGVLVVEERGAHAEKEGLAAVGETQMVKS